MRIPVILKAILVLPFFLLTLRSVPRPPQTPLIVVHMTNCGGSTSTTTDEMNGCPPWGCNRGHPLVLQITSFWWCKVYLTGGNGSLKPSIDNPLILLRWNRPGFPPLTSNPLVDGVVPDDCHINPHVGLVCRGDAAQMPEDGTVLLPPGPPQNVTIKTARK